MIAWRMPTRLSTDFTKRFKCWTASPARGAAARSYLRGCKVFPLAATSFSIMLWPTRSKLSVSCTALVTSRVFLRATQGISVRTGKRIAWEPETLKKAGGQPSYAYGSNPQDKLWVALYKHVLKTGGRGRDASRPNAVHS